MFLGIVEALVVSPFWSCLYFLSGVPVNVQRNGFANLIYKKRNYSAKFTKDFLHPVGIARSVENKSANASLHPVGMQPYWLLRSHSYGMRKISYGSKSSTERSIPTGCKQKILLNNYQKTTTSVAKSR